MITAKEARSLYDHSSAEVKTYLDKYVDEAFEEAKKAATSKD